MASVPGSTAARYRTSIGRAYYGAFHCAVQALDAMGAPVGNGPQAHAHAYRLLQQGGDAPLNAAGGLLDDLHTLRNRADYQLDPSSLVESQANAMVAAANALRIAEEIDLVLSDAIRLTNVKATIRARYPGVTGQTPPP